MSDIKSPPELSMDEILASIRRILAEDEKSIPPLREPSAPVPEQAEDEDVFELTQAIDADGTIRSLAGPSRPAEPAAAAQTPAEAAVRDDPLLSAAATHQVADSFTRLAETRSAYPEPAMPNVEGKPLGDAVPEMLRPLLQAWLDAHLPEIVERLVRAEIARIRGDRTDAA